MKQRFRGSYPPDWPAIARRVKDDAGWRCVRCGHPHDPASGHTLTVHHLSGDRSDCGWANTLALCQRCHLHIQGTVILARPWMFAHSAWFRPYAAAWYARKYRGLTLSRAEVDARLDELLALEPAALFGTVPS